MFSLFRFLFLSGHDDKNSRINRPARARSRYRTSDSMAEHERPLIKFCHFYRRVARRFVKKKRVAGSGSSDWIIRIHWLCDGCMIIRATTKRGTNLILESRARRVSTVPPRRVSVNYDAMPIEPFVSDAFDALRLRRVSLLSNEDRNKIASIPGSLISL